MGYGFLIFDSKENADKALQELQGKYMPNASNKTFQLNHASFNDRKKENGHSLYVCDLNHNVTSDKLISFFKTKYKSVIGSKIIVDPKTKVSKGYGFVSFSDEKEREKAMIEMNGKLLNDRAIKTGNAWYKKNDYYRSKRTYFYHNPKKYFEQQYQQLISNPYFVANNYYANFFNPLFQKQIYSQIEEYLNNTQAGNKLNGLIDNVNTYE
jgi:RNA recognition motif-containing protein